MTKKTFFFNQLEKSWLTSISFLSSSSIRDFSISASASLFFISSISRDVSSLNFSNCRTSSFVVSLDSSNFCFSPSLSPYSRSSFLSSSRFMFFIDDISSSCLALAELRSSTSFKVWKIEKSAIILFPVVLLRFFQLSFFYVHICK